MRMMPPEVEPRGLVRVVFVEFMSCSAQICAGEEPEEPEESFWGSRSCSWSCFAASGFDSPKEALTRSHVVVIGSAHDTHRKFKSQVEA